MLYNHQPDRVKLVFGKFCAIAAETKFIMTVADETKEGTISKNEVLFALKCFKTYLTSESKINKAFEKYDKNNSGKLELDQLTEFLVDLNDGLPVTQKEAQWVMKRADVIGDGSINRVELLGAVAAWFAYAEEKQRSACCTVT